MTRFLAGVLLGLLVAGPLSAPNTYAQETYKGSRLSEAALAAPSPAKSGIRGQVACAQGKAGEYPCLNADLMSFMSFTDLVGTLSPTTNEANDVWGWTDPETGVEYVLLGLEHGTAFVDISDPEAPFTVGFLPSTNVQRGEMRGIVPQPYYSVWRDIKVYANHAFVVADASNTHGMQVFDLTRLRGVASPPVTFDNTALYTGIASAHNLVINEDTGFAYAVGSNSGGTTCGGGLHMIDIRTPAAPLSAGCFADILTGRSGTGYTHDAQCVIYHGPDTDYTGHEICIGSNETMVSVADVTDKANPVAISRISYPGAAYIHQGWLTEDHRYFFQDDELDELNQFTSRTRTLVWDLSDLDDPLYFSDFLSSQASIDHNQYVRGNLLYQSNYSSGLRIYNIADVETPVEVGYFDTRPTDGAITFTGSWSNYPYFESGIVAVSSIDEGLFLVRPTGTAVDTAAEQPDPTGAFQLSPAYPNPFTDVSRVSLSVDESALLTVEVFDILGRQVATLYQGTVAGGSTLLLDFVAGDLPDGHYLIRARSGEATVSRLAVILR
ncbi:MAG: choice-of-anchor B family protein [Rhodothermales bacterium]|nr:choice-of-anchor B family protein [Rhodothermales bacterium]